LEKHVNECPNCFVLVDTTKKTLQKSNKGVEPQTIPESVKARLWKALEKKIAARKAQA